MAVAQLAENRGHLSASLPSDFFLTTGISRLSTGFQQGTLASPRLRFRPVERPSGWTARAVGPRFAEFPNQTTVNFSLIFLTRGREQTLLAAVWRMWRNPPGLPPMGHVMSPILPLSFLATLL